MSEVELSRDEEQILRYLNLVLETGRMNGAFVGTDLRHTWVHNSAPEPPEEDILGKTDTELFSEEMATPTMELKREAIETESRVEREFTFIKPSGQNRYRAAAAPLYDSDENIDGAMFAAVDLSRRFQYLNRTTDALYTVDQDWTITFWNDQMAERTGIEAREVVGTNLWERFGDSVPPELEEQYRTAMESGEPVEFEQYLAEPYDYWVEARVFPDEHGLTIATREITDRKEYEQQLERQRDRLEILNAMLRHDIRNDIQLVRAYTELVMEEREEDETEHLNTILEKADHATELTKTAGEIAKALSSTGSTRESISVRDVLEDEIDRFRDAYPDTSVMVSGKVPAVEVVGDKMLGSVFRNLLNNAVQHNDKPIPEVDVRVESDKDDVTVHIADNGPGIPDCQKSEIFGQGEKRDDSSGTGIGLYLVEMLVKNYSGTVSVEDNEPEGTIFSVTLPKYK